MRRMICGCDLMWCRADACSERQATLDLLNSHWMKVPTEMREVPNALCRYVVAYHARLHGAVGASSKNHKQTYQNGRKLKPKIETVSPPGGATDRVAHTLRASITSAPPRVTATNYRSHYTTDFID